MKKPETPKNEQERLEALGNYSILDTLEEEEYDNLTSIAAQILKTKISLVSLIDDHRQWFKSHHGLEVRETPKDFSFCAHAINKPDEIFIVNDARKDERFKDNPLVTGEPYVIFYAGMPIVDSNGFALGSFCVIDSEAREISDTEMTALKAFAKQTSKLFELRKSEIENENLIKKLKLNNAALSQFAQKAAHDLKSPLNSIIPVADLIKNYYSDKLDEDGIGLLDLMKSSAQKLDNLIDGILEYSTSIHNISNSKQEILVNTIMKDISNIYRGKAEIELNYDKNLSIFSNKAAFQQILLNLVSNAVKYNDKEIKKVKIYITKTEEFLKIEISDNGMGIRDEELAHIFQIFGKTSNEPSDGSKSTGIGLATVKSLTEALNGKISVESKIGEGSKFTVFI